MEYLQRALRIFGGAAELAISVNTRNLRKRPLNPKLLEGARDYVKHLGLEPDSNPRMLMMQCLGAMESQDDNHLRAAKAQRASLGLETTYEMLEAKRKLIDWVDTMSYVDIPPEYEK